MRRRLSRARLAFTDRVYGIRHSGAMDREPDGVTEIFSHPARGAWDGVETAAAAYRFEDEFQALIDTGVKVAVTSSGARPATFKDI